MECNIQLSMDQKNFKIAITVKGIPSYTFSLSLSLFLSLSVCLFVCVCVCRRQSRFSRESWDWREPPPPPLAFSHLSHRGWWCVCVCVFCWFVFCEFMRFYCTYCYDESPHIHVGWLWVVHCVSSTVSQS